MTRPFFFVIALTLLTLSFGLAQPRGLSQLASFQVGETPIWLYSVQPQAPLIQAPFAVDTCSGTYLIAVGAQDAVWLIVKFAEDGAGRRQAEFYQSASALSPLSYRLVQDELEVTGVLPTVTLRTREAAPPGPDCWLDNGDSVYDLELSIDGVEGFSTDGAFPDKIPDGEPDIDVSVYGTSGVPEEQVARVLNKPTGESKGRHLRVTQRMEGAPPFAVMTPLFEAFAYFSLGEPLLGSRWFSENWSPVYFDLETRRLQIVDFVGFKMGGVYWVNSSAYAPEVNFESPMAFYSFDPSNRYAHLIVRADHGFDTNKLRDPVPEMSFRYSWKTRSGKDLRYGLQLLGSQRYSDQVTIAKTELNLVPYAELPAWIMNQSWPVMTFIESTDGYGGGEGIYYYTVQGGLAYNYLAGRSDSRPKYFTEPYLTSTTRLSDYAVRGLPIGFRGEYGAARESEPKLYFSEIDGRVHLIGAGGGVWHLGDDLVLRSEDLTGDGFIDSWWRQRPGTPTTEGDYTVASADLPAEERFSVLPGQHVLYEGESGIELSRYEQTPARYRLSPPTDQESWYAFGADLAAYEQASPPKNPYDLASWRWEAGEDLLDAPGAQVSSLWVRPGRLELGFRAPEGAVFRGEALAAGDYVVSYRVVSDSWDVATLEPMRLEANLRRQGATELLLTNTGNVTFSGPVALETGGEALFDWQEVTVAPGATRRLELDFIPQTVLKQAELISFSGVAPPTAFPLSEAALPNRPPPYELFRLSSASGGTFALLITLVLTCLFATLTWAWRRVQ